MDHIIQSVEKVEKVEDIGQPKTSVEPEDDEHFYDPVSFEFLDIQWDQPLSQIVRPTNLKNYIGQSHLLAKDGQISNFLKLKYLPSMILHGPPGSGKTTLASILAKEANCVFVEMSATDGTVEDLKLLSASIQTENTKRRRLNKEYLSVVVFIDEIHRFKINQQDYLLPLIESGLFVFIGATTLNPSLRLRKAILSRCQVFELRVLTKIDLYKILDTAIVYENIKRKIRGNFKFLRYESKIKTLLVNQCHGDSRKLINYVEVISMAFKSSEHTIAGESYSETLGYFSVVKMIKVLDSVNTSPIGFKDPKRLYIALFNAISGSRRSTSIRNAGLKRNSLKRTSSKVVNQNSSSSTETSLGSKINDSNDNFYDNDANRYILPADDVSQYDHAAQMQYSDTEEEINPILLSDCESDYELIDISDSSRSRVVKCLKILLLLLKSNESPNSILRNLLLFSVLYVDDSSQLIQIIALLKTFKSVNVNIRKSLSNLIERTAKLKKKRFPIYKLNLCKRYFQSQKPTTPEVTTPEIVMDDAEVSRLLQAPKQIPQTPSILVIDSLDLDDPDVNIGTGDDSIFHSIHSN